MGKRGRKSQSDTQKLDSIERKPPEPPLGMREEAVDVWNRIINSMGWDYYKPHQYDLLRNYCEVAVLREETMKDIEKDGFYSPGMGGTTKVNPAMDVLSKTSAIMASLSTKLGINANMYQPVNRNKKRAADRAASSSSREGLMFGGKAVNE